MSDGFHNFVDNWQQLDGNAEEFSVENVVIPHKDPNVRTLFAGKTLFALGSSITWGFASGGQALGEFLARSFGMNLVKDAENGTTLAPMHAHDSHCYVSRLKTHTRYTDSPDYVLIQLSTNDVWQGISLGQTVDAIEDIMDYVQDQWNVPVLMYTNSRFESEQYQQLVDASYDIHNTKNFSIIDLWNNVDINSVTDEQLQLYMHDPIHPTRAGYMTWWGPEVARQFERAIRG